MLQIVDLHVNYGNVRALRGVNIEIKEGSIVSLLGANGAGKSTVQKSVMGLVKPKSGTVSFQGQRIDGRPTDKIVSKGVVMIPEGRQIFPELTVLENLKMGRYIRKDHAQVKLDMDYVFSLFPILSDRSKQLAGTLSGGQQQMLAIGRGLMTSPTLLLLDEPSLGLAPIVVQEIFNILKVINSKGTTILLVEQNASMALRISDYAYVLENGAISVQGASQELQNNDDVRKTYLGGE